MFDFVKDWRNIFVKKISYNFYSITTTTLPASLTPAANIMIRRGQSRAQAIVYA